MKVIWQPKALKQFKKVGDRAIQERIQTVTRELSAFPACPNVKPVVNHEYGYRLRLSAAGRQNWRILFNAFEEISIVSIEEVKKTR